MNDGRIRELDDIKSSLVLIMLLFHSASGLTLYQEQLGSLTQTLYFIHYAFVMMTGLLCGLYYQARAEAEPRLVRRRLWSRGGKLLGVLLAANAVLYGLHLLPLKQLITFLEADAGCWHLLIAPPGSLLAFEILYYIALFLLTVPLFIPWTKDWMFLGISGLLLFYTDAVLLFCIAWGGIGMGMGAMIKKRAWCSSMLIRIQPYCGAAVIPLAVLVWFNTPQTVKIPLVTPLLLLLETLLWFASFIWVLRLGNLGTRVQLLGRYTLVGYIGQMLIIAFLAPLAQIIASRAWGAYLLVLVPAFLLTLLGIWILDKLRKRSKLINQIYQLIFT